MAIQWIEITDIPEHGKRGYGRVLDELQMFVNSTHAACEVDIQRYKDSRIARNCYVAASKKLGYDTKIAVLIRNKKLFIVKREALEKC